MILSSCYRCGGLGGTEVKIKATKVQVCVWFIFPPLVYAMVKPSFCVVLLIDQSDILVVFWLREQL